MITIMSIIRLGEFTSSARERALTPPRESKKQTALIPLDILVLIDTKTEKAINKSEVRSEGTKATTLANIISSYVMSIKKH